LSKLTALLLPHLRHCEERKHPAALAQGRSDVAALLAMKG